MGIAIQQRASGLWSYGQGLIDRTIITPETRQKYYRSISQLAQEQPLLFSFITIHLLLSFLPIALFTTFVVSTVLLSLLAAVLFSLFWIGVALLFLIPTLFITVTIGVLVWIWGVSCFVVARWVGGVVLGGRQRGELVRVVNGKEGAFEGKGN